MLFKFITVMLMLGLIGCTNPSGPTSDPTVTNVIIVPESINLEKGSSQNFHANVIGVGNPIQSVEWSIIGSENHGTFIQDGYLTIAFDELAPSLLIKATSVVDSSKYGLATVIIDGNSSDIESVTVTPDSITLDKGETTTFYATVEGENDPSQNVLWIVEDAFHPDTKISSEGVLTIAPEESSLRLTVRAISLANTFISGTAVVEIIMSVDEVYAFVLNNGSYEASFRMNINGTIPKVPETYNGIPVTKFALSTNFIVFTKSLILPKSIQEFRIMDRVTYSNNNRIQEFIVDEENQYLSSENGVLFNKDKSFLFSFPYGSSITEYSIPDTVEIIGTYAFFGNGTIERVTIPSSVRIMGESAFLSCRGLKDVIFAENSNLTEIPYAAFQHCGSLETIRIPEGVETLYTWSFLNCWSLKTVYLPSTFSYAYRDFLDVFISYDGDGIEYFEIAPGNTRFK